MLVQLKMHSTRPDYAIMAKAKYTRATKFYDPTEELEIKKPQRRVLFEEDDVDDDLAIKRPQKRLPFVDDTDFRKASNGSDVESDYTDFSDERGDPEFEEMMDEYTRSVQLAGGADDVESEDDGSGEEEGDEEEHENRGDKESDGGEDDSDDEGADRDGSGEEEGEDVGNGGDSGEGDKEQDEEGEDIGNGGDGEQDEEGEDDQDAEADVINTLDPQKSDPFGHQDLLDMSWRRQTGATNQRTKWDSGLPDDSTAVTTITQMVLTKLKDLEDHRAEFTTYKDQLRELVTTTSFEYRADTVVPVQQSKFKALMTSRCRELFFLEGIRLYLEAKWSVLTKYNNVLSFLINMQFSNIIKRVENFELRVMNDDGSCVTFEDGRFRFSTANASYRLTPIELKVFLLIMRHGWNWYNNMLRNPMQLTTATVKLLKTFFKNN